MIESLLQESTVEETAQRLAELGWNHVATSNWCEVYADPNDRRAARLSAFDPTQTLFAALCIELADNRWLPKVEAIVPLRDGGEAIVMERLWPAFEHEAEALVAAIDLPARSERTRRARETGISRFEPDVLALRERLKRLFAETQERFPRFWGGADIREGKIMADAEGHLKLCDPAFLSGPAINRAILEGDADTLAELTRDEIRRFLRLPYFGKDLDRRMIRNELARSLDALDLPESRATE